MPDISATEPCPFCGQPIERSARHCRHCGERLDDLDEDNGLGRRGGGTAPVLKWVVPVDRSGWAIAAGYLGLLSCFPFVGLLCGIGAVVTGLLALREIRRRPALGGRGRAIFGLVMGAVVGLGNLALVVIFIIGAASGWK